MCDLSERALLFICMVWGFVGIFTTSLGFAKCFCKPLFILQVIFIAWRSFCSLEIILQPKGIKKHIFPQPKGNFTGGSYGAAKTFRSQMGISQPILMFGSHFVVILKLGDHFTVIWKFGNHLATKWEFRSPFQSLKIILHPF